MVSEIPGFFFLGARQYQTPSRRKPCDDRSSLGMTLRWPKGFRRAILDARDPGWIETRKIGGYFTRTLIDD